MTSPSRITAVPDHPPAHQAQQAPATLFGTPSASTAMADERHSVEPDDHGDFARHPGRDLSQVRVHARGEALDSGLRDEMSARLGTRLPDVRLHRDAVAADVTRRLDATAVTSGADVYLAPDAPTPDTTGGRAVLAHELAHVIQQARGSGRVPSGADALEAEASAIATAPGTTVVGSAPPGVPQRLGRDEADRQATDEDMAMLLRSRYADIDQFIGTTPEAKRRALEDAQDWLKEHYDHARGPRERAEAARLLADARRRLRGRPAPKPGAQAPTGTSGAAARGPAVAVAGRAPVGPVQRSDEGDEQPKPWSEVDPIPIVNPSSKSPRSAPREPEVGSRLGSLGGPKIGPLNLLGSTGEQYIPPWVPREIIEDVRTARLEPGTYLRPYLWPSGFKGSLIIQVGAGSPVLGRALRFYRLYPDDLDFWRHYASNDEDAARVLQKKWITRNKDMWHFVHDLGYPAEHAEAELDYIDDQVYKALVGTFASILGAGAGISQVGSGVARRSAPAGIERLEPGQKLEGLRPQYGRQIRNFAENDLPKLREEVTAGTQPVAQVPKAGGGGSTMGMAPTLQAAPGGGVATGQSPVPLPGPAPSAPSLAERSGWGGTRWSGVGYAPQPLPSAREGLQRFGPVGPAADRDAITVGVAPPVGTIVLPGLTVPEGTPSEPVGDPRQDTETRKLPGLESEQHGPVGDKPYEGEPLKAPGTEESADAMFELSNAKPPAVRKRDVAAANRYLNSVLRVLQDPKHPLHFLVVPRSGTTPSGAPFRRKFAWRVTTRVTESGVVQVGRYEGSETGPIVQIGHQGAFAAGAEEVFMIEDADLNQLSGATVETPGSFSYKDAYLIGGLAVDIASAHQWARLPKMLDPKWLKNPTVIKAPKPPGQ
jgi:hypothetical protein